MDTTLFRNIKIHIHTHTHAHTHTRAHTHTHNEFAWSLPQVIFIQFSFVNRHTNPKSGITAQCKKIALHSQHILARFKQGPVISTLGLAIWSYSYMQQLMEKT